MIFINPLLSWSLYWMRSTLKRNTCTRTIKKHSSWSLTSEDSYVIGIVTAMHFLFLSSKVIPMSIYILLHQGSDFPGDSAVKKKKTHPQCRRCRFDPWSGRSPGAGHGNPVFLPELWSIGSQRIRHDWRDWTRMHARTHAHQDSLKRLEFELWKSF